MDDDITTRHAIHRWNERLDRQMPDWWEWSVAAAQYHLRDCNWVTTGVTAGQHCSCCLTRVIAKILDEGGGPHQVAPLSTGHVARLLRLWDQLDEDGRDACLGILKITAAARPNE